MPRDYQPIGDTWQRYAVPLRLDDEDGRAMGREYTELRADELTDAEIATLSAGERAEVEADLAAMDATADLCGVDDPAAWRDGDAMVRRTDPPMAAE